MLFDTQAQGFVRKRPGEADSGYNFDSTMREFTEPKVIALPLLVLVECVHGGISVPCAKDTWAIASSANSSYEVVEDTVATWAPFRLRPKGNRYW